MIQRIVLEAASKKTVICIILAVFFCVFTICLHAPDQDGIRQATTTDASTDNKDRSGSGNMASALNDNDLLFGIFMVNGMITRSSQSLLQIVTLNKSAAPILRFVFSWFVIFAAISLLIGYWYLNHKDRLLKHTYFIYTVLHFIHKSDGKKSVL